MRRLVGGGALVAVADMLGQVLGEVADAPASVLRSGEHALRVEPLTEPGDVQWLVVLADCVECLIPGGQDFPCARVGVGCHVLVPYGVVTAVELDALSGGPPHLVVGRGDDLPQLGAGDRAADREVNVWGESSLRLDGREVLNVVAAEPAKVLHEPVEQRREVQRVPRGPLIVIGVRVDRRALGADLAVRGAGQGNEERWPEGLAVRRGVDLADRPVADLAAGKLCGVLA